MGLDAVELVMAVEEDFDIEIADIEASQTVTVGELYELILLKLSVKNREFDKKEVWEKLKRRIIENIGVKPEKLVPDARFVKDLGVN